jgi:tRNA-2-methylthio-N6-dimethylallyladenosine synthase
MVRVSTEKHGKAFYIETFGCQMNFHDTEKVIGVLQQQGYQQVDSVEEADLIFYNTCSIRDKAEQKVFHRLADHKLLQKQGKKFAVLGCVAQQEGEEIFARAPHVSLVAGSASYSHLPEMLVQIQHNERVTGLDDREARVSFETAFTARANPYRGYLTIIEGCDKFCAYCVVPYTRGRERSRSSAAILEEARQMIGQGITDIQLLGQNVNSYVDPTGKMNFAELLSAAGELDGIRRVRFTTSHPRHFTRDIVQAIESNPRICNHIHLPVQSGSTRVLAAMNREYSREQYLEKIGWIHGASRYIALTTDIIVGFPGETEAEFEDTMSLMRDVCYDGAFSFKYSPRPNTPAISLPDSIAESIKDERLKALNDQQREIQRAIYSKYIGTIVEAMVEGANHARGQLHGHTAENKTVNFTCAQSVLPALGSYVKVLVKSALPNSLTGELVL